jgi:hypothetical protein
MFHIISFCIGVASGTRASGLVDDSMVTAFSIK